MSRPNTTRPQPPAWELLHRAGLLADLLFQRNVGRSDYTARQYAVLAAIAQSEGSNHAAIIAATGIDRSTVSEMVGRLVARGWLRRRRSKEDTRAYIVQLTDAGREALKDGDAAARKTDEALLSALLTSRRAQFADALGKIGEAVSVPRRQSRRPRSVG
jgi:DNA-binding MarR family transcriptional regulator